MDDAPASNSPARTLVVYRHAKADHDGGPDELRSLTARGRRDAAAGGQWLVDNGVVPDLAVVSTATRARQTWESAGQALDPAPPVTVDARIYDNTIEALLAVVADVSDDVPTVAIVGHNPSFHAFAAMLDDGDGSDDARSTLAEGFPTNGIAVFAVAGSWRDVALGGATLRAVAAPRD